MTGRETFDGFTTPERVAATEPERALLATATPTSIDGDDGRIAAWRFGDQGPRVLLVHGWNSRASHLGGFVAPLRARGYQVIAFDAPAHGDSDGARTSVVHVGRAIRRVAEAVGWIDGVVSHSIGSTATLFALAQGLRVRASVHLAGPTSGERRLYDAINASALMPAEAYTFRKLFEAYIGMPASTVELPYLSSGLRHPGLLIHDPLDRVIPFAESEALHLAWRASTLLVTGGGHARILRAPDVIDRTVRWLDASLRPRTASLAA
ncbi:MAG: alpha/beta hydrolase [Deltaproteobacteria bacterium]|nr:alpha/beta hydrolase [Kofleriaceae bacterium]